MKQQIKLLLMLLFVSVSFFMKGQTPLDDCGYLPSIGTVAATVNLTDNTGALTPTLVNFLTTLGGGNSTNGYFYRNRIIVGDPNGNTGAPANVTHLGTIIPHAPFQRSMFQAFGGIVHDNTEARSSVNTLINQDGIGISFSALSDAGYPNPATIYSFGVHGEQIFNNFTGNANLPNSAGALFTAGGYFRNHLVDQSQFSLPIFGNPFVINGGTIGHIVNQPLNPNSNLNSAVIGLDDTRGPTHGMDINGDNKPDIIETINNWGFPISLVTGLKNGVGLNYAGAFLGRGYFSNRVGIGPQSNTSTPAATTALLHIDGTGILGDEDGVLGKNVLRVVGMTFHPEDTVLVIDPHGYVRKQPWPESQPCVCPTPPSQICNTNFNVNHGAGGASTALICGRIWDDGNGGSTTLGSNVGINTINTSQFFTVNGGAPAAINTGTVRTDGRFQMNGITSTATTEVLGIRPSTDLSNPNEVVRFRLPTFCVVPSNTGRGDGTDLVCGRIWDDIASNNTGIYGNVGINTPTSSRFATLGGTSANGFIRTDGRFQMNGINNANTNFSYMGIINGSNEVVRVPIPTGPAADCAWELKGNDNITAIGRGTIIIPSTLCVGNLNNFIGTRSTIVSTGTPTPNDETQDLVFATRNQGWMRLTTGGALFLTDRNLGAPFNPGTLPTGGGGNNLSWGNIRLGLYAGGDGGNHNGVDNILIGHNSGFGNTSISRNIFIGNNTGRNCQANGQLFIGHNAGFNAANIGQEENLIIGNYSVAEATASNLTRGFNTFIGHHSGSANTTGPGNTFIGNQSGIENTTGAMNTYIGSEQGVGIGGLNLNPTSSRNTVIGSNAQLGPPNNLGLNTFVGYRAGVNVTDGANNTVIGANSLGGNNSVTNRVNNVIIGVSTANNITGDQNVIIGNSSGGAVNSNNTFVGNGSGAASGGGIGNGNDNVLIGRNTTMEANVNGSIALAPNYLLQGGNNNIAIVPGTFPNVANIGNNYIKIGRQSTSIPSPNTINLGTNGIAIGTDAISGGNNGNAIAIGTNANGSNFSTSIGRNALSINSGISIGVNSSSNMSAGSNAIAIGNSTISSVESSIAIGFQSNAIGAQSTAIGINAIANDHNSYAIGTNSVSQGERVITIGEYVPATTPGALQTVNLDPRWLRVGIGTGTITAQMTASGVPIPANSYATTRFHVKCDNLPNLPTVGSGIRFENLQVRNGCPNGGVSNLVIDRLGYVYADAVLCGTYPRMANPETNDLKTDSLQKQIDELKAIIATMAKDVDKCCTKTGSNPIQDFPINNDIKLYQNVPNPFTIGTEIKFFVPETVKVASLIIYDLNGREIRKMDINERNESSIKIQGKELAAGMYIYSLIADSKEVDSKRMILTGN